MASREPFPSSDPVGFPAEHLEPPQEQTQTLVEPKPEALKYVAEVGARGVLADAIGFFNYGSMGSCLVGSFTGERIRAWADEAIKHLASYGLSIQPAHSSSATMRAALVEAREALKPFVSFEIDDKLRDDAMVPVEIDFTREEAEVFNREIEARGLPVKKADIERGTNWPKRCLCLDGIELKDYRRAHVAYSRIDAALNAGGEGDGWLPTKHDLDILRQWYGALEDVAPKYLDARDSTLYRKIVEASGAVPAPPTPAKTVLEQSERWDSERGHVVVQTVRAADGSEQKLELYETCSICGAKSDNPFPRHAISCTRPECLTTPAKGD